jgi:NADH:ubiquinone oxidoreductase subunit E
MREFIDVSDVRWSPPKNAGFDPILVARGAGTPTDWTNRPGAVPRVAHALNLSQAEVHGVITFYHDFRSAPPGRHVLKLCRAEACQAMGSEALAARLTQRLGIAWRETSPDAP